MFILAIRNPNPKDENILFGFDTESDRQKTLDEILGINPEIDYLLTECDDE